MPGSEYLYHARRTKRLESIFLQCSVVIEYFLSIPTFWTL